MNKYVVFLTVLAVVLAVSEARPGLLGLGSKENTEAHVRKDEGKRLLAGIGQASEDFGKSINKGTMKLEAKITGLFHKEEKTTMPPELAVAKNAGEQDRRDQLLGAPRCGPDEIYVRGACQEAP